MWDWLIPIQPVGSKPPLFLLHGTGELGRQMGKEQPVYGGRTHGLDGRRVPLRIEEIAADYLPEIRMVQPEGPYFVGGHSVGGLLAFEVARQLKEQGQEVALLVLLDPASPNYSRLGPGVSSSTSQVGIRRLREEVWRYLRELWFLGVREKLAYLGRGVRWRFAEIPSRIKSSMMRQVKMLACRVFLSVGRRVPEGLRMFYFMETHRQAVRNYVPGVYPGRVVLLTTNERAETGSVNWGQLLTGRLEIYEMPGGHMDVTQGPLAKLWAKRLRACLQDAQTQLAVQSEIVPGERAMELVHQEEISEAIIKHHPAVREAVVTAREEVPGDWRLVAYIVPKSGQALIVAELRKVLRDKLPGYMMPSAFVLLDALPLTPNGKIDRQALPVPNESRRELEEDFVAPRTQAEKVIADTWAQVLKLNEVSVHDNFFDLGGHSLLATQIISRLGEAFHLELPLRSLFEAPTVASLAASITQRQTEADEPAETARLVATLEALSDEEADSQLTEEGSPRGHNTNG